MKGVENVELVRKWCSLSTPDLISQIFFEKELYKHLLWDKRRANTFGLLNVYLTATVCQVVPQKSIPAQIRQLIFISVMIKDKLTDLWGNWLLQSDFTNTFCEIRSEVRSSERGHGRGDRCRICTRVGLKSRIFDDRGGKCCIGTLKGVANVKLVHERGDKCWIGTRKRRLMSNRYTKGLAKVKSVHERGYKCRIGTRNGWQMSEPSDQTSARAS